MSIFIGYEHRPEGCAVRQRSGKGVSILDVIVAGRRIGRGESVGLAHVVRVVRAYDWHTVSDVLENSPNEFVQVIHVEGGRT